MEWNERLWRQSQQYLSQFMVPLVEVLGRSERRVAATRYVEGLLLPGQPANLRCSTFPLRRVQNLAHRGCRPQTNPKQIQ